MNIITYNPDLRSFSSTPTTTSTASSLKFKDIVKIAGLSALVSVVPAAVKVISNRYGTQTRDKLLRDRNARLNQLSDKYVKEGLAAQSDPTAIKKYEQEIHRLYEQTLYLSKYEHGNKPKEDNDLENYINPFLALLRLILHRNVHIILGTKVGADRRNFELVFDPDHVNVEDVIRDPFRTVLYKYPWPAHGFEVSSGSEADVNDFIDSCIKWVSKNNRYLSIRV